MHRGALFFIRLQNGPKMFLKAIPTRASRPFPSSLRLGTIARHSPQTFCRGSRVGCNDLDFAGGTPATTVMFEDAIISPECLLVLFANALRSRRSRPLHRGFAPNLSRHWAREVEQLVLDVFQKKEEFRLFSFSILQV
jgi:hypothetical protein